MVVALDSLVFAVCALCAGMMGFAIQRGATCTVAAVEEMVSRKKATRLASLAEASVWVAGGLLLAQAFRLQPALPGGFALTGWTVAGGALLGLGAFVNQACVFGAIARLGSGQWAYAFTPVGFFIGCRSAAWLFVDTPAPPVEQGGALPSAAPWLLVLFIPLACWRAAQALQALVSLWRASDQERTARRVGLWSAHAATTVIAITFCILLLLAGSWAYTDVLAELARGMGSQLVVRVGWLIALFLGALLGGWHSGLLKVNPVTLRQTSRTLLGGVLMGWGSLLIPGSNDGLILVGLPLLRPYAWVAFLTMCGVVTGMMLLERGRNGIGHRA